MDSVWIIFQGHGHDAIWVASTRERAAEYIKRREAEAAIDAHRLLIAQEYPLDDHPVQNRNTVMLSGFAAEE